MESIDKFTLATLKYLNSIEVISFKETEAKFKSGEYQYVSIMIWLRNRIDNSPGRLMIPTQLWEEYLSVVEEVFQGTINRKLLQRCIEETLKRPSEWPMPESQNLEYSKEISEILHRNSERFQTAFIPLANVIFTSQTNLEIPLARAILKSPVYGSNLTELLHRIGSQIRKEIDFPEDCLYLEVAVQGDQESIAKQTRAELRHALSVLRFISPWYHTIEGTKRIYYNPAAYVSPHPNIFTQFIHGDQKSWGSTTLYPQRTYRITSELFSNFVEYYGLNDINFHFQTPENEISERILTALEWYDSAVQAETNWKSLYRYITCINAVLPNSGSKIKNIKERFRILIQYSEDFIGSISTVPLSEEIDNYLEILEDRLGYLYSRKRGNIVHGQIDSTSLTPEDIKDARLMSHNSIRLVAKLAKIFAWRTDQDAEDWFQNPVHFA